MGLKERTIVLLVCLTVREACCDYACLCSYQKLSIFDQPDPSSNVDGYMNTFDCKASYKVDGLDAAFSAVGNKGRLGYVTMTPSVIINKCQGSISDTDRVKTTSTLSTPTTTPRPTTTTRRPTTTTPRPTTTTPRLTTTTPRPTTTTPRPTLQVTPDPCPVIAKQKAKPQNLFQSRGICYEFVPTKSSWKHAQNDCTSKGGHLLSIENADQQSYVSSILLSLDIKSPVWLGLYDGVNEEHWIWDTGVAVSYTNWLPGRYLDQYHDQEDCGVMVPVRKHQWDDVDCNGITFWGFVSYPWICQYI